MRAACAALNRSDMKLQNTDTTNRLKTLSQMKNSAASSLALNSSRFSAKKAYTTGRSLARGSRAHSQPKAGTDRKSTRLNSSHRCISYAVFCLKKKKKQKEQT